MLVKFQNLLEEEEEEILFGILDNTGFIHCLCGCKGSFEPEDYKILEEFPPRNNADKHLKITSTRRSKAVSTRCYICIENKNHTYTGIYCHNNGETKHNGKILAENYTDHNKVLELLALGSISSLAKNIDPPPNAIHSFDEPIEDVCVAYHRDRGESLQKAQTLSIADAQDSWCEYLYVFCLDGKWRYYDLEKDSFILQNLSPEIIPLGYYDSEQCHCEYTIYDFKDVLEGVKS